MARFAATLLFSVGACLLAGCQDTTPPACGEILQEKCQTCHSLVRTCDGLGRDKESWQRTIAKMANYSSVITGKDQKILVECLGQPKKDVAELCRE
ncbi:MAG: hypothetical protein KKD73_00275 [Proteobacteria bacterium]|nr:hypothetical protein [Pseudomonadota bacterium]MBU1639116.1 hypothetical protein [Pseudomonadota bacterium]